LIQQGNRTVTGSTLMTLLKCAAVLIAASILGNWFMAELGKARSAAAPWYKPYLSTPGILIIIAILLPVVYWFVIR
jgi:hypothetical protein